MFNGVKKSPLKRKKENALVPSLKLRRIDGNKYQILPEERGGSSSSKTSKRYKGCFNDKLYTKVWRLRGCKDILTALFNQRRHIKRSILHHLHKNQPLKFYITVKTHLYRIDSKTDLKYTEVVYFHGRTRIILKSNEFDQLYDDAREKIWRQFDNWLKNGSGYRIDRVENIQLTIAKYTPIFGTSYIKTPQSLLGKHALINVKNHDNLCFIWSVLSALYTNDVKGNLGEVSSYRKYLNMLKYDADSMPMQIENIPHFEKKNGIAINVYSVKENGCQVNPLYLTKIRDKTLINLLLIMGKEKNHYVWIKHFNRLLCNNGNSRKDAKVFCPFCMYGFVKRYNGVSRLMNHVEQCSELAPQRIVFPNKGEEFLKFDEFEKGMKMPFVIYADFECINKSVKSKENNNKTKKKSIHKVSGYCFTVVSPYYKSRMFSYRGKDAAIKFLQNIFTEEKKIMNIFKYEDKQMKQLTSKQQKQYLESNLCHICKEHILVEDDKGVKVRDHCHFTGDYRGSAHQQCNLKYRKVKKIPVFFHNLSSYDSHLIFQYINKLKGVKEPNVLAKSMEKFIAFSIGNLHFKDSLQFLNASLEKLVFNLKVKASKENNVKGVFKCTFKYFNKRWSHLPDEAFEMLMRKGVYPYSYMNSFKKFKETKIPKKEDYYNDLTLKHISNEDYDFAHKLFETFNLKNLGELHDLYMESDVLLLADVFENFRIFSMNNYELDPTHFFTAPGLSWSAALKYTGVKLELPTDPDISIFFDKGLIGGISMIGNQFARANNEELGVEYEKSKMISHIMLLDCNNQYGWAMSQYLPYGGFKWVNDLEDTHAINLNTDIEYWREGIMSLQDEDSVGFIFEVDLEYAKELHDLHDTYPLAPEHVNIKEDMLSEYQKKLAKKLGIKIGGDKLCLTLNNKQNYICHYRNLKQYLSLGLKLMSVRKVLKFQQSPWLKKYIELNTKLRQEANSKFEEDQPKLMNNAYFGKTCEDVRKYNDIRIVMTARKAQKLINKVTFTRVKIYDKDLTAFQLRRQVVKLNKPRYVGMTILSLSKIVMYEFHYNFILPKYPNVKLLFTDTDSFCYWIPTSSNIYKDLKGNERIDFSNYETNHPNFDLSNKLIPGKFKDETGGIPILEFVGLRAKMYSILKLDGKTKATCKGISEAVKNEYLKHQHYKDTLQGGKLRYDTIIRILQDEHQLYTVETIKNSLSPFNDKKYITKENGILKSLSFGHYLIGEKRKT